VAYETWQAHRPRRRESVCLALQQAERYGTPLGAACASWRRKIGDMADERGRKKARAPPKLTVPMILFFLPVLFRRHSRADRHQDRGEAVIRGAAAGHDPERARPNRPCRGKSRRRSAAGFVRTTDADHLVRLARLYCSGDRLFVAAS